MKALRLVIGLNLMLFLASSCGGVEVEDELDTALSSEEAALATADAGPAPSDAGTPGPTDAGPAPSDAGTSGPADAGAGGFSCPGSVGINGQAAAASCCMSQDADPGDNPLSSCVSDWCVTQCKEDCGSNPICYTFCYSACRDGVRCTCG